DVIVRRRLIQKMEFVTEALAAATLTPPTEAELTAYLAAHPDSFRTVPRFSLQQVFVRSSAVDEVPPKQGMMKGMGTEGLQKISPFQRAEALRLQLQAGADPTHIGDPLLQSPQLTLQSQSELARSFGSEFASAVVALPLQTWSAPIPSSFGVHVVQVTQREEGRPALLSEVRAQVQELLQQEQRLAKKQQVLSQLHAQYQVHIDTLLPMQPQQATPMSTR
ncbi:MAG TPA: peptidylprolyl isomerase, partial [Pseudomonadota bacterium]|nr:peptidylprolyl isomerase [Pseudomonadota bacterium]